MRGRSFDELGRRFTWVDLRSILKMLPPESHVGRVINPKGALVAEWSTPEITMLGLVHDSLRIQILLAGGAKVSDLPKQGLLSMVLENLTADDEQEKKPAKPRKKQALPADIRKAIAARTT